MVVRNWWCSFIQETMLKEDKADDAISMDGTSLVSTLRGANSVQSTTRSRNGSLIRVSFIFATLTLVVAWILAFVSLVPLVIPTQRSTSDRADVELVREYYAAINRYLDSGSSDNLAQLVDENLIDTAAQASGEFGVDALERQLSQFRTIAPNARLATDLVLADDRVVVSRVFVESESDS